MDGRVKTLHPRIHGGLLGRRGVDDAVMRDHGIEPIDLLAVNLYPFAADRRAARTAPTTRPSRTSTSADRPWCAPRPRTMRGRRRRRPGRLRARVLDEHRRPGRHRPSALRRRLAAKAFAHTAQLRRDGSRLSRAASSTTAPQRPLPECSTCRSASASTCATARTRTSTRAFYARPAPQRRVVATARAAAGQGTLLQQHRRRRHRARVRAAVRASRPASSSSTPIPAASRSAPTSARPTSAPTAPIRPRPSAASSPSTGRSTPRTARAIVAQQFVEVILAPEVERRGAGRCSAAQGERARARRRATRRRPRGGAASTAASPADCSCRRATTGSVERATTLRIVTDARADGGASCADLLFAWRVAQVRQVQRDRLRARPGDRRRRRRPDEPRRLSSRIAAIKAAEAGLSLRGRRDRLRRLLPVPRRPRRGGRATASRAVIQPGGSHARRRGHRGGRRARPRDGVHRHAPLPGTDGR